MKAVTPFIYPIGTVGQPWGDAEKSLWLNQQKQTKRSYQQDVVSALQSLPDEAELLQYGHIDYSRHQLPDYALYAVRSKNWQPELPVLLVTGGVHGYETSGVHGALAFIQQHFTEFSAKANLLILPCISPWGYETINRWNPDAVDPNRSFSPTGEAAEAQLAMACIQSHSGTVLMHIDLHETTDSDNSEFRPAKAARDGSVNTNWNIPDGFYLVGDTERPEAGFQKAVIDAVAKVTHIAPADEHGCLIGEKLQQFGVVNYPKRSLGLCGGFTDAPFVTTTEVYPDSPNTNPAECNQAQVAAVVAAMQFALAN
ncbi:M14 family metallocarboxypeptidase [Rheinheimera sp.]|uniref:M14 family metallopeptidase n=1 Tax=Rheinheimera sp. TaxID=1869214 RepID=UPI00307EE6CC